MPTTQTLDVASAAGRAGANFLPAVKDHVENLHKRAPILLTSVGGTSAAVTATASPTPVAMVDGLRFLLIPTVSIAPGAQLTIAPFAAGYILDAAGGFPSVPLLAGSICELVRIGSGYRLVGGDVGATATMAAEIQAAAAQIAAVAVPALPHVLDGLMPVALFSAPSGAMMLGGAWCAVTDLLTISSAAKRVVGPTGTLDTIAANSPAWDWSAGRRRLLVEAVAATKYGPYSEALSNAQWVKTGIAAGAAIAGPDGTTGLTTFTEDGSTGYHRVGTSVPGASVAAAGEAWAQQIIVKRTGGSRNLLVQMAGTGFAATHTVTVDLGTGAILAQTGLGQAVVTALSGGCWRIEMTATSGAAGTVSVYAYFVSGTATTSYAGDGASALALGYTNLEKVTGTAERPSSYVTVSGTASVTRVADDVRPTAALLARLAGGYTLVLRGSATMAATNQRIFAFATSSTAFHWHTTNTQMGSYDGATNLVATAGSSATTSFGAALTAGTGVWKIAVNGGAVATNAAPGSAVTSPTAARLFAQTSGGAATNGFVDEIVVWPFTASTTGLQAQARSWS